MADDTSLSAHQRNAVKARWERATPEQRSAHAKKMVAAREAKRAINKALNDPERVQEVAELSAADQRRMLDKAQSANLPGREQNAN